MTLSGPHQSDESAFVAGECLHMPARSSSSDGLWSYLPCVDVASVAVWLFE
jgi:hypothetical protein